MSSCVPRVPRAQFSRLRDGVGLYLPSVHWKNERTCALKRSAKETDVTSLTLAVAMQVALLGANPNDDTYAKAHEITMKTGQPMVILVGAKWCPACVQMKTSVVPQLKERGSLTDVSFAEVDFDRERELARTLIKGGKIPQLLMYRKTKLGWRLRRIIGGQSVDKVDHFIAEGVALDKATKRQEAMASKQGGESRQAATRPAGEHRS